MSRISSLVKRYPLIAFFVLACALSWWPWILYTFSLLPTPIIGLPFVAAFIVLAVTEGKSGVVELLRRMVRWRVRLRWYAVALLLPVVVTLAAAALNVGLLGAQPSSSVADPSGLWTLFSTFFVLLLIPGLGGSWEEPGFRGYALPRLQVGRSALLASLVLGVLWAFWHLPLVVTGVDTWIDGFLFTIVWTPVFTWLFNNAIGSVLIVMLFHNMNNAFSGVFVGQMFSGQDSVNQAWLRLTLWGIVAIVLVVVYGSQHLSRKHQKQVEPVEPEVAAASPPAV
jgi:membrane protease YdiL (CAAX protease family)